MPRIALFFLFFLVVPQLFPNSPVMADDAPECVQLAEKASGDQARYSIYGEANGPIYFSGISCAIEHRNKSLCAMEMVSFDSTAKVYDMATGDEVTASNGYFWVDEKNNAPRVLAFGSKEAAEKYLAGKNYGRIVDYTGLTENFSK